MFAISYLKISLLKKLILPIFIISLILLILVPFIGVEIKGARRWLDFYIFRLQPIELIKPFFVLITASLITSGKEKNSNYSYFLSLFFLSVIIILLINQPDLGQTILLVTTWVSIVFISGVDKLYFIVVCFLIICFVSLLVIFPEKFGYIFQDKHFLTQQKVIIFKPIKLWQLLNKED